MVETAAQAVAKAHALVETEKARNGCKDAWLEEVEDRCREPVGPRQVKARPARIPELEGEEARERDAPDRTHRKEDPYPPGEHLLHVPPGGNPAEVPAPGAETLGRVCAPNFPPYAPRT